MNISTDYPFLRISALRPESSNIVIHPNDSKCLIPGKIEALKMLDLQNKSGIKSI